MKSISSVVEALSVDSLHPDTSNPRVPDQARMALLRLSIQKLGFIMPVYATEDGMLLSGHQRLTAATSLGLDTVAGITVIVKEADIKGINILFNRATNDFSAFDTGLRASERLKYADVLEAAEALPDFEGEDWYALHAEETPLKGLCPDADGYDKKAGGVAENMMRLKIRIPIVVSDTGRLVNGLHRLHAAKEKGEKTWPVITIPDALAEVALTFLNYLSMDFHVDDEFAAMLRHSAYRRPQNNRGSVPKAYRFWANGCRTLMDANSYSVDYWRNFRDLHGHTILDFGAGLGKVAPFLRDKGMDCFDFEPYRIDFEKDKGKPCPHYSKAEARKFLERVASGVKIDSIFLASVLNSVPFPKDRMAVLAIVHALSTKATVIYGTCRDITDFNYEYGGVRNANYFVFDSEPGVRVGDVIRNPKIQKFTTTEEADAMFSRLWNKRDYWPGGNVFYYCLKSPKGVNVNVLRTALLFEFELPYADGTTMDLGDFAIECFNKRLKINMPLRTEEERADMSKFTATK